MEGKNSQTWADPRTAEVLNGRVSAGYDAVAHFYDDSYKDNVAWAQEEWLRRWLRNAVRPNARVLDVGCGTGLLLDLIEVSPANYWGVDVSGEMLLRAKDRHPDYHFALADQCDLVDVADNEFDVVVGLWSFSYAMFPVRAVEEFYRVLRPGGTIYQVVYAPEHRFRMEGVNPALRKHAVPNIKWDAASLNALFHDFLVEEVRGLEWLTDHLSFLPPRVLSRLMQWESWWAPPTRCYYTILKARKS